jgi:hypothetical protein
VFLRTIFTPAVGVVQSSAPAADAIQRKLNGNFTPPDPGAGYADPVKRQAFVVHLATGTRPSDRHFDGWIEEVDTGRELRFRSTAELLAFLGQCFERGQREREKDQERT